MFSGESISMEMSLGDGGADTGWSNFSCRILHSQEEKKKKKRKENNNEDQLAVEDYTTFALRGGLKSVRRTD